jgi:diguanylate cyclase (GGDEF)-like protein/PAS domain S-box-containing protein
MATSRGREAGHLNLWRKEAREERLRLSNLKVEHAAFIRGKQLYTFRELLPFGLTSSSANASLVFTYLAFHAPSQALWLWGTLMALMGLLGFHASYRVIRHKSEPRPRTASELYRPIVESTLLGLAWSIFPVLFIPVLSGFDLAIVLWVCAGMMTGAAFVLSTLPAAAIPFVASLSFGTALGILRSGSGPAQLWLLLLLGIFTIVMIKATSWNYASHVRSWLQRVKLRDQTRELEENNAVISLLLNEFGESSSDCLWELDSELRLTRPSKHLSERTGMPVEMLDGAPMLNFFDKDVPEARTELARLTEALEAHDSFREIRLPVKQPGGTVWWEMSAKPVFNDLGGFEGYRGVGTDITEKRSAEKKIEFLAHHDSLTGVPKQHVLLEALQAAASAFADRSEIFALHCIDFDRFKTINDVHGHAMGNAVLQAGAQRILKAIGPNDIVARFGGDEFVILQRNISGPGEAMALALTIQEEMTQPIFTETESVQTTVSVGIALFPDHSGDANELFRFADMALMAAKEGGRAAAQFFESSMNDVVRRRTLMESDLRGALANNEFCLHYQPIVDAKSGEVRAYETLIRWNHPKRGPVSPVEFVPILEKTGMIWQVGNWIIREALAEASTWDPSLRVCINLSPLQVQNRSLTMIVTHALAQTGVDPRRVDFEITETALFDGAEDSLSVMHALHDLGATVSLDDFGTGYSSLSYLRKFPFNKIKIDKSFVDQLETSHECAAIVEAVVSLAGKLGMRTTAEGIENAEQVRRLVEEGCTELQGYHFSRPASAVELERLGLLKRRSADPAPVPEKVANDDRPPLRLVHAR